MLLKTNLVHQEKMNLILHDFTPTYIILSLKRMFLTVEKNISIVKPISAMRTGNGHSPRSGLKSGMGQKEETETNHHRVNTLEKGDDMMKKTICKRGSSGKGRRGGLWAVSLIVSIQVVGLVLFSMATPGPVGAKTFTVNSTLDEIDTSPGDGVCKSASGYCTLRAAIQEANALLGTDVIKLKTNLYMLTIAGRLEDACVTGDLDITDDLSIIGTGVKNTFINGGKLDRVFHIMADSVTITDVTIQNGLATDGFAADTAVGGGIYNESATLTLRGITISNNAASGGDSAAGGGIYNDGTLTITRSPITGRKSTISNNVARGNTQGYGGGIYNDAVLTIKANTLLFMNVASGVGTGSYGSGGGIFNADTLTITGSTFSNNVASGIAVGSGGGIYNDATSTVIGSTISNNVARGVMGYGGGITNLGTPDRTLTVTGSTISNNSALGGIGGEGNGGGIHNGMGETLTITGSTLSDNTASGPYAVGGGISNYDGPLTVTGSMLSNNTALALAGLSHGGGIYAQSTTLMVKGSTISDNTASGSGEGWGGGICGDSSDVTVESTTISSNAASGMLGPGYGGGIFHLGNTLTVQRISKIIKNLASNLGGGVYTGINPWSSSTNSTVVGNMPDNISYD